MDIHVYSDCVHSKLLERPTARCPAQTGLISSSCSSINVTAVADLSWSVKYTPTSDHRLLSLVSQGRDVTLTDDVTRTPPPIAGHAHCRNLHPDNMYSSNPLMNAAVSTHYCIYILHPPQPINPSTSPAGHVSLSAFRILIITTSSKNAWQNLACK